MYETSTGGEAYDAYEVWSISSLENEYSCKNLRSAALEVVLTVDGHRCAAVLTVVPEAGSHKGLNLQKGLQGICQLSQP